MNEALYVPPGGGYGMTHVFHPYPGRFHAHLPHTLLPRIAGKEAMVCDPFMGGGTTLVEAALLGMSAIGNDLNPIANLVARERVRPRTAQQAGMVTRAAEKIAEQVDALRKDKQAPRARIARLDRLAPHYQPHLLAEFAQWHRLIHEQREGHVRDTLQAIFSSAVVKFSNRRSDSRPEEEPPRYPKGKVSRFLVERAHELTGAQVALDSKLSERLRVRLLNEDGTLLPSLGWGVADLVITSPPYPGTYDYLDQHRLRMDWLEMDDAAFAAGEIGARRDQEDSQSWADAVSSLMLTLSRILRPRGSAYLVIGDWISEGHAVDARHAMERLAKAKGWRLDSWAAAERPAHSRFEKRVFSKKGKWEHLLHFVREAKDGAVKSEKVPEKPEKK